MATTTTRLQDLDHRLCTERRCPLCAGFGCHIDGMLYLCRGSTSPLFEDLRERALADAAALVAPCGRLLIEVSR